MKLHYSQTVDGFDIVYDAFDYLMKLHYSQTINSTPPFTFVFDYLMKLHYSQTTIFAWPPVLTVWLPYEITLLSN